MSLLSPLNTEQISKAVHLLSQQRPAYAPMLAFYQDVFISQEKAKSDMDLEPIRASAEALATRNREERPLIEISQFRFDDAAGARLLTTLCDIIAQHGTEMRTAAEAVADALGRDDLKVSDLFGRLLAGDDAFFRKTAETVGTDQHTLSFLSFHSIQPSLEIGAMQLAHYLESEKIWPKGFCPVCGSAPGLGILGEEGRRILSCSFCRHQWYAPRIFCAFCENTQSGELHYFFAEEEKDLRVDGCDRCHNYLKSVDRREAARPVFPPLEQVASLHLDMIAAEKGFSGGINLNFER